MGNVVITSYGNAKVKHIKKLCRDAAYRREQGLYVAEGSTLMEDAMRSDNAPYLVVLGDHAGAQGIEDTEVMVVTEAIFSHMSTLINPEGIMCVCPIPERLEEPPVKGRWLLLDRIQDPGNVGSIMRTAEAFGLDGIYLTPGCADPYNPKAVRAAMGATLRLPTGVLSAKKMIDGPLPVYAADAEGRSIGEGMAEDCVVALGSEGEGVCGILRTRSEKMIAIPMRGKAESLGVAAAAAILCWEMSGRGGAECRH
jgi:TrmH family RNA methyltransferase